MARRQESHAPPAAIEPSVIHDTSVRNQIRSVFGPSTSRGKVTSSSEGIQNTLCSRSSSIHLLRSIPTRLDVSPLTAHDD